MICYHKFHVEGVHIVVDSYHLSIMMCQKRLQIHMICPL